MADIVPKQGKREGKIDVEDVRFFLMDRTAEDNPLELDLFFTDPEIQQAFRFAAMKFNEIHPQTFNVDPAALQFGFGMLQGVIYCLFMMKMAQLSRSDIDYVAGNMTIEINKRRIAYFEKWIPFFKQEFEMTATQHKVKVNLENAYRCY